MGNPSEYKGLSLLFVVALIVCRDFAFDPLLMSRDMRFPTMWYVRPAKAQTSLRIRVV